MPNKETFFTIKVKKTTDAHVEFNLYANGAKTGDLVMSEAEFQIFKATVCDDTMHCNNFELGMMISELHNLKRAGWKVLSLGRLKYWSVGHGYTQHINNAGDFNFEKAKKIVEGANIALHSDYAKMLGAEELLIYHPSQD